MVDNIYKNIELQAAEYSQSTCKFSLMNNLDIPKLMGFPFDTTPNGTDIAGGNSLGWQSPILGIEQFNVQKSINWAGVEFD